MTDVKQPEGASVQQAVERLAVAMTLSSGVCHVPKEDLRLVLAALAEAQRDLEFERGRVERDEETIRTLNACWAAAQAEAAKLREQANELIEALAHDHQGGPPCFIGCDSCQLVADMAIALAAPLPAPTPRALSPDAADHGDGK